MTIILLLVAALAFSQSPAQTSGGRVSGRVAVEGTDTPIPDAQVWLLAISEPTPGFERINPFASSIQTKSDESGQFVFEGIAPGTYLLNATARRPFGARYPGEGFVRPPSYSPFTIQVAAGQSLDGLDFHLRKGGVFAGRVVDRSGEPRPDVEVHALFIVPGPPGAIGEVISAQEAQADVIDERGRFRVSGLGAGDYYLVANPRSQTFYDVPSARGTAVVQTFYPEAVAQSSASTITLKAGDMVDNFVLTVQTVPAFRISGIVVDEKGKPVGGASVDFYGSALPRRGSARTREDGRFVFGDVPAGNYRINAQIPIDMRPGASGAALRGRRSVGNDREVVVKTADVADVRVIMGR